MTYIPMVLTDPTIHEHKTLTAITQAVSIADSLLITVQKQGSPTAAMVG